MSILQYDIVCDHVRQSNDIVSAHCTIRIYIKQTVRVHSCSLPFISKIFVYTIIEHNRLNGIHIALLGLYQVILKSCLVIEHNISRLYHRNYSV